MIIDRRIVVASWIAGAFMPGCASDPSSELEPSGSTVSHEDVGAPSLDDTAAKAGASCRTLPDAVAAAYRMALLREPDASGQSYWLLQLQSGMAPLDMLRNLVRSSEFTAAHTGLTDSQFVTGLYGGFLDRAPDSGGFAYWLQELVDARAAGTDITTTRTDVALSFVDSTEFQTDGIHGCFF
jgi:hypothetical protein